MFPQRFTSATTTWKHWTWFGLVWLVWLVVGSCGVSTFVDYLTPNSVYMYIHSNQRFLNEYLVGKTFYKQDFICLYMIISFNSSYFFVQPCLSQEGQNILTFSNNSVKLITLKNRFLMTAKAQHSIRICLAVQVVWHVKHCGCGCGSCFSIKAWVSLIWPMRNRDITTCSLLDVLKAGLYSPKVGWIWKSFIMDIHVPSLLPFCVKEFTDYRFQIGKWNGDNFRA